MHRLQFIQPRALERLVRLDYGGSDFFEKFRCYHCGDPEGISLWITFHDISPNDWAVDVLNDVKHLPRRQASWFMVRNTRCKCRVGVDLIGQKTSHGIKRPYTFSLIALKAPFSLNLYRYQERLPIGSDLIFLCNRPLSSLFENIAIDFKCLIYCWHTYIGSHLEEDLCKFSGVTSYIYRRAC